MKKLSTILLLLVAFAGTTTANAQIRMGLKVGATVNSTEFDLKNLDLDNTSLANFTGGVTLEWMVAAGFGFDVSALYTAKGTEYTIGENLIGSAFDDIKSGSLKNTVHYIEVPVNIKYKLEIPAIEKIIAPYVFAGPSFAFKVGETIKFGDDAGGEHIKIDNKGVDYAINVGIGLEIIEKLQVSAQYGWGIGTASELKATNIEKEWAKSKSGTWAVTVGWLF